MVKSRLREKRTIHGKEGNEMTDLEQIIDEMRRRHISPRELAERSGVSRSTIYRILNREVTPDTATMQLLESALGIRREAKTPPSIHIDFSDRRCYKSVTVVITRRKRRLRHRK